MTMGAKAAPAAEARAADVVWSPYIISPAAGTVWEAKSVVNVIWDTSNAPGSISNRASVRLRRGGTNTGLILANSFDLRAGSVEVTVPWMVDGDQYQIVLFGDSGNIGEDFTIHSGIEV